MRECMKRLTLYSLEEKSRFVDFRASSYRERSCGNDMENNLVFSSE